MSCSSNHKFKTTELVRLLRQISQQQADRVVFLKSKCGVTQTVDTCVLRRFPRPNNHTSAETSQIG